MRATRGHPGASPSPCLVGSGASAHHGAAGTEQEAAGNGAIVAALALIGLGLLNLLAPNLLWSLTKFGNEWEGRQSERTGLWDARRVLGGVGLLVLGVVVLVWAVSSA